LSAWADFVTRPLSGWDPHLQRSRTPQFVFNEAPAAAQVAGQRVSQVQKSLSRGSAWRRNRLTDPADHCDARSCTRGHHRLIAALSAILECPFRPDHSLIGPGQVWRIDHMSRCRLPETISSPDVASLSGRTEPGPSFRTVCLRAVRSLAAVIAVHLGNGFLIKPDV
jgi:hypothetical protein